jgi:hypothetical protein
MSAMSGKKVPGGVEQGVFMTPVFLWDFKIRGLRKP